MYCHPAGCLPQGMGGAGCDSMITARASTGLLARVLHCWHTATTMCMHLPLLILLRSPSRLVVANMSAIMSDSRGVTAP